MQPATWRGSHSSAPCAFSCWHWVSAPIPPSFRSSMACFCSHCLIAILSNWLLFRSVLVSAEVGLSAALLILAALLGVSFMKVLRSDKGFRAPTVLAGDVAIPLSKYQEAEQRDRFYEEVLARLQSHPGIHSAAISTALPLTGETWIDSAWVPGDPRPPVERPVANVRFVSQDYLRTMGIPLLAGRTFSQHDRNRKVAILSERFAAALC